MDRILLRYEGRVQGVGFRVSVVELAENFDVSGRVWNVSDGSVRVAAEGESATLVEFQTAIATRMSRNIVRSSVNWESVKWENGNQRRWTDFGIAPDTVS